MQNSKSDLHTSIWSVMSNTLLRRYVPGAGACTYLPSHDLALGTVILPKPDQ